MVDVIVQDATFSATSGSSNVQNRNIYVTRILDPNCGTTSAVGWGPSFYDSNVDYGSFGSLKNTADQSSGVDRHMFMLDVADWPNDTEWHGSNLVNIDSQGYYPGGVPANSKLLRAIVKVHPNSYNVQNNEGYLQIL